MKRACLLVVLFLVAIQPTDVGGQDLAARDGNALLRLCAVALEPNAAGDGRAGVCIGMVAAVSDLADDTCFPRDRSTGPMIFVVMNYLSEHPEELDERDTTLILRALQDAFPCQQ